MMNKKKSPNENFLPGCLAAGVYCKPVDLIVVGRTPTAAGDSKQRFLNDFHFIQLLIQLLPKISLLNMQRFARKECQVSIKAFL